MPTVYSDALVDLKRSAVFMRDDLKWLSDKVRKLSPKDADALEKIIYQLTVWQNRDT